MPNSNSMKMKLDSSLQNHSDQIIRLKILDEERTSQPVLHYRQAHTPIGRLQITSWQISPVKIRSSAKTIIILSITTDCDDTYNIPTRIRLVVKFHRWHWNCPIKVKVPTISVQKESTIDWVWKWIGLGVKYRVLEIERYVRYMIGLWYSWCVKSKSDFHQKPIDFGFRVNRITSLLDIQIYDTILTY